MDIEELTKSQIVLLVILISFVTSMATGIVTVSLMDQAPTSVAQTVNRVIQQTIREVSMPAQSASVSAPVAAASVKTVIIKQSDEIASAVRLATPSVVHLYSSDGTTFLGLGVFVGPAGNILTDDAAMGDTEDATVTLAGGSTVRASVTTRDSGAGVVILSVASSSISTSTPALAPIALAPSAPILGETVVVLSGQSSPWVGNGLISSLGTAGSSKEPLVKTNISGDNVLYGSPLIDASGNLVGISTSVSRASGASVFEPVSALLLDIAQGSISK